MNGYRISVHNALGTPDEAVEIAHGLNVSLMPSGVRGPGPTRPGCGTRSANGQQTLTALRRVEQEADQEVRRPALRALTASLLYGPARVQGLRDFAVRT
ncbi:hypothetical protein ACFWIN_06160 [Streptomyces sp. NPDC127049]|uniref:hypothetical protein n=1 Tax=Streptomyces TaxID=1883 RepID=UPI0036673AD3